MKKSDLDLNNYEMSVMFDGTRKGSWFYNEEYARKINKTLRRATDTQDFVYSFLEDAENEHFDSYPIMFAQYMPMRRIVKKIESDAIDPMNDFASFDYTISDAGSVKVGTKDFSILIPNGYGDCATLVVVTNEKTLAGKLAFRAGKESGMLEGTFNVYHCDCGDEISFTLTGKYFAYTLEKAVVFVKAATV